MVHVDVRRLAALDMHGAAGNPWRRRVVLAEFVLAAVAAPVLGVLALRGTGAGTRILGWWLVSIGANYLVLALHGLSLARPGALAAELAGADIPAELRRYSIAQAWIAVPLALVAFALRRAGWRA